MEIVKAIAVNSPMLIASFVLVIAALLKVLSKEQGAILVLVGAIGLGLNAIAIPVIYQGIMPKVIESVIERGGDIQRIYFSLNLVTNVCWAGAIGLIALGTFLRSSNEGKSSPNL